MKKKEIDIKQKITDFMKENEIDYYNVQILIENRNRFVVNFRGDQLFRSQCAIECLKQSLKQ